MISKGRKRLVRRILYAINNDKPLTLSTSELRMLNVKASEHWYDSYQEMDSPKGETVPGVRFRGVCNA